MDSSSDKLSANVVDPSQQTSDRHVSSRTGTSGQRSQSENIRNSIREHQNDDSANASQRRSIAVPSLNLHNGQGCPMSHEMPAGATVPRTSLQSLICQANQMNTPDSNDTIRAAEMICARQQAAMLYGRNFEEEQTGLSEVQIIAALQQQKSSNPLPPNDIIRTMQQNNSRNTGSPHTDLDLSKSSKQEFNLKIMDQDTETEHVISNEEHSPNEDPKMYWDELPSLDLTLETCMDRARGLDFEPMAHLVIGEKMRGHMDRMSPVFTRLHDALATHLGVSMQNIDTDPDVKAKLATYKRALYAKAEYEVKTASQLDPDMLDQDDHPAQHQLNLLFHTIKDLDGNIRSVPAEDLKVWKASCYITAMRWQKEIHEAWIEELLMDEQQRSESVLSDDDLSDSRLRASRRKHRLSESSVEKSSSSPKRRPGRPPGSKNKTATASGKKPDRTKASGSKFQSSQTSSPAQLHLEDDGPFIGRSISSASPRLPIWSPSMGPHPSSINRSIQFFGPTRKAPQAYCPTFSSSDTVPNPYQQRQYHLTPPTSTFTPRLEPHSDYDSQSTSCDATFLSSYGSQPPSIPLPPLKPEYAGLGSRQQHLDEDSDQEDPDLDPNDQS